MRVMTAVLLVFMMFDVMICSAFAVVYVKAADDKIAITTESTMELTPAQIKHEIDGIDKDIASIEASKQFYIDRKARYQEMLDQCATLGIKDANEAVVVE